MKTWRVFKVRFPDASTADTTRLTKPSESGVTDKVNSPSAATGARWPSISSLTPGSVRPVTMDDIAVDVDPGDVECGRHCILPADTAERKPLETFASRSRVRDCHRARRQRLANRSSLVH